MRKKYNSNVPSLGTVRDILKMWNYDFNKSAGITIPADLNYFNELLTSLKTSVNIFMVFSEISS
jgi:hypothetical protein